MSDQQTPDTTPYVGFVRRRGDRFYIDKRRKLGSFMVNQVILLEMLRVLNQHFSNARGGTMLDAGAGTRPYSIVYRQYFAHCISTDVAHSPHDIGGVNILAPLHALPFDDATFDFILCTEVLEHVPDPVAALTELHRVMKPGGVLYITTPFMVPLHEMPYDFYRYTPSALKHMSERAGLQVESIVEKGDYLGFAISNFAWPFSKFWMMASRLTHLRLYHPYNPFVYLPVVLPQSLYISYWKHIRSKTSATFLTKLYNKLKYVTAGYLTVLRKG